MSVLDKNVSYFQSKNDTRNGVIINLLQLLNSDRHRETIETLRAETDSAVQKQMKECLPCYTVAGTFERRSEDGLVTPSGLAAVDLDSAEDYDTENLLNELKKLRFIAYAGLSCRGQRLFAIVPFLHPDKYPKHYERLIRSFEDIGFPMGDTCHKAMSQPRFVSWNTGETCFYNHDAAPYHLLPVERVYYHVKSSRSVNSNDPGDPFRWCDEQIRKSHSFSHGNRHKYIIALARYCNMKGIPEPDTLSGCLGAYCSGDFAGDEISKIVNHVYIKHAESHNELPFKSSASSDKKSGSLDPPLLQATQPTGNMDEVSKTIAANKKKPTILDLPADLKQGKGKFSSVMISETGKVYKPVPYGKTEVYDSLSDLHKNNPPAEVLSFSEWFQVKENFILSNFTIYF